MLELAFAGNEKKDEDKYGIAFYSTMERLGNTKCV